MHVRHAATPTALLLALAAGVVHAGPLSPPAGPVGSTYKTMTDVEPRTAINAANTPGDATCLYKITAPGSYYLIGNIANGSPTKAAIKVTATGVTIDLNGFIISGGGSGISTNGACDDISVRNGFISGTATHGIDLGSAARSRVKDVSVTNPGGLGIIVWDSGVVADCQVRGGTTGISAGENSILSRSNVISANGNGIHADTNSIVDHCATLGCAGVGFNITGTGCRVTECVAQTSSVRGFEIGNWSTVEHCLAVSNSGMGFNLGTGGTIRHCTAEWNGSQGIVANGGCSVVDNKVSYCPTGIAAIWLQGTQNVCESNNCVSCGYGVFTTTTSNVIIKNTVTGATTKSFQIGTGNAVGTIVVPTYTGVVISGNSGGGLGTSDPNVNFAY